MIAFIRASNCVYLFMADFVHKNCKVTPQVPAGKIQKKIAEKLANSRQKKNKK